MVLVDERRPRLDDLAVALDVDPVRTVDHHLVHLGVGQQSADRPVAEDVVGEVLHQLGPVSGRQRHLLPAEDDLEVLLELAAQLVLADAAVVEERADLVDEEVVHPLAQLVEDRVAARGELGEIAALDLVEALVEGHRHSFLVGPQARLKRDRPFLTGAGDTAAPAKRSASSSKARATSDRGASSTTGTPLFTDWGTATSLGTRHPARRPRVRSTSATSSCTLESAR